ncbi:MAG: hypothetical protein ACKO0V_15710, partial [bacterium]
KRDSISAYADGDETNRNEGSKSISHVREAEIILAAMLVNYLKQTYDLIWFLISTLIIHVIFTLFFLNSYPFQPAGDLYKWFAFIGGVAIVTCVWVMIGISRDGVMARVKRSPEGLWILNGDLVGKLVGFAAPILTLLATLSLGFSDLFRVLFRPFF